MRQAVQFWNLEKDMVTIKTEPRVIFPEKRGRELFKDMSFLKQARYARKGKPISSYTPLVITMNCAMLPAKALTEISLTAALWLVRVISSLDSNLSEKHAANYLGNTHGGLLKLEDKWYVFYHRANQPSFVFPAGLVPRSFGVTKTERFCRQRSQAAA